MMIIAFLNVKNAVKKKGCLPAVKYAEILKTIKTGHDYHGLHDRARARLKSEQSREWGKRRVKTLKIVSKLETLSYAGFGRRRLQVVADRMRNCGEQAFVSLKDRNPQSAKMHLYHCRERLCEVCNYIRYKHLFVKIQKFLFIAHYEQGSRLRFLTLTQIARPGEPLIRSMARLQAAWRELRKLKIWTENVTGYVAAKQITRHEPDPWDAEQGAVGWWHSHLHIIVTGNFMPVEDLRRDWLRISGAWNVDIREIRDLDIGNFSSAIAETIGYLLKGAADLQPAALSDYLYGGKGLRMISTGGRWHNNSAFSVVDSEFESPEGIEFFTFSELERLAYSEGAAWAENTLIFLNSEIEKPIENRENVIEFTKRRRN